MTSIKTNKAAMDRWFLTVHLKANVSSAFFSMLGLNKETHTTSHKENTIRRTENDEELVKSMSNLTKERMFNPFLVEDDWTVEDPKPLCNIATGLVASDEVVETNGKKQLDEFVTKRLNTQEEEFFEPMTKNKIYSFATEKKKARVKKDGKIVSIDLDRQIMSRLVVISSTRDFDLQNLFEYKLSTVPLSLFNPHGTIRKSNRRT